VTQRYAVQTLERPPAEAGLSVIARPVDERAARAAGRLGLESAQVERLPFDLSVLNDAGIFLNVDARNFGLLDRRLDWRALGITLPRGGGLSFRPPHCGLIPDRYRLPLLRPAGRAHAALHRFSYHFRLVESVFETVAYRWVPWGAWETFERAFATEQAQLRAALDAYKADFPTIRDRVLETFRQLAADSARRLAATGQPVPPAFEEAVVDEVLASLPTPEVLSERLTLQYRVGVMQLGSEMWAEARLAADEQYRAQEIESEARLARQRTQMASRCPGCRSWPGCTASARPQRAEHHGRRHSLRRRPHHGLRVGSRRPSDPSRTAQCARRAAPGPAGVAGGGSGGDCTHHGGAPDGTCTHTRPHPALGVLIQGRSNVSTSATRPPQRAVHGRARLSPLWPRPGPAGVERLAHVSAGGAAPGWGAAHAARRLAPPTLCDLRRRGHTERGEVSARPERRPDRLGRRATAAGPTAQVARRPARQRLPGCVIAPAHTRVVYHAGCCALCDQVIEGTGAAQEVRLHIFGPAGTVAVQCWLCPACQPTPATVSATSGILLKSVLGWYRSTPFVWPTLQLALGD
jgi:hypothetical protein